MAYLKKACILGIALLLLSSCGRQKDITDEKPVLMVSIAPQKYLLSQLTGDSYEILTMLERGANPETFDPSLDKRLSAEGAEAYFSSGVFPFEKSIRESLKADKPFIDTSKGIEYIYGTHSHSHSDDEHHDGGHDEEADPHVWTSVGNAKIIAGNMAQALTSLMPDSATVYAERLARLNQRLDSIDKAIRTGLADGDSVFAIWHPSLSYLARDYGLEQIAVGQESKEMGARKVRSIIDEARSKEVRIFFFQKEYDTRQAESINEGIGSTIVTIDPLSEDWEGQMKIIVDALSRP